MTLISSANGILAPKTNLDLYLDSDLIVMGKVLSLEEIKDVSNTTPRTSYEIIISQYIKGNTETNQITVVGFGSLNSTMQMDNQIIMSEGQKALLMLNEQIDGYLYISPYSLSSDFLNPDLHFILPPLKLLKAGISSEDIHCKSHLELALKSSNGSPVCLKSESKNILYNRGWIK
ncbi:MAG: hypothetical protein OEQ12_04450 [Nitrosopumilus sp.]|nr:hypothetical protein [Nitrosopumilus sp.]